MSQFEWYWHRLRAMGPGEMALHARKKICQFTDAHRDRDWAAVALECSGVFPKLALPNQAPALLRESLKRDADHISAGRWKAFGHLELKVDDPPKWHCDYLVGKDLATNQSAFRLNHRELPAGADIKLIWELSRWHQLVRLAMAACVLDDERAGRKCVAWLEDWVRRNPPYRGWNWTSALEAGLRLVNFTWLDALLSAAQSGSGVPPDPLERRPEIQDRRDACPTLELERLRYEILPPHVWFAWRHRSFGSSANNHLIGELAGLILATVRWPALAQWGAPLEELQRRWEHEVLAQFAEDGGNKEQALNYHLFSWEFCWQARLALLEAGRTISPQVGERMLRAARFYWEAQAGQEAWDFGDSDNAFVTPFAANESAVAQEWRGWLEGTKAGVSMAHWLGRPPGFKPSLGSGDPSHTISVAHWWVYPQTGIALCELGLWWLRWDLSPLGYLGTAAHGHMDALHLSIWFKRTAMVIDPGTGAYYSDEELRTWLASPTAHNGPCPAGGQFPKRLGPFLWADHHERPRWKAALPEESGETKLTAELRLPEGLLRRSIGRAEQADGWRVADEFIADAGLTRDFTVRWQFAPGSWVKKLDERKFLVKRGEAAVAVEVDGAWAAVELIEAAAGPVSPARARASASELEAWYAGVVSPAFRRVERAPFLKLVARPSEEIRVFHTVFLAAGTS